MVDLWISEKADFVPGVFPANSRTGRPEDVAHYTQLIWGRSGEVGCGLGQRGGEEILVCRYSAPGNVRGRDPFAQDWQEAFVRPAARQSSRSEEHTSELQSLMRLSYAVFCLTKKKNKPHKQKH